MSISDASTLRQRIGSAISGGYDFADTLHNIYLDFGYPQTLDFSNYWSMYRRFGIAKNIVELPPDMGWMTNPLIIGSDAFNRELEVLDGQIKLFNRLKALDTRQRVGRYAGLFMRVRDNLPPENPLETSLQGPGGVISLMPVYEGNLTVSTVDNDPQSDDFGMPEMYNFDSGSTGNRDELFSTAFKIHPSRLIIAAEGADQGGIYGISSLEAPYNSLMDLRKIIGGGGEGFYKNAAKDIVFTLPPEAMSQIRDNPDDIDKFTEQLDDFTHNRMRRSLFMPGLEAKSLEATLANPKEFFNNALSDCAASSKIPSTNLIGYQTGRLASDENSKQLLSWINSRRLNFMTELVRSVIDWFIRNGVLPASEYEVEWDDLLAASFQEKLANSKMMADINQTQFTSGQDISFTSDELREAAGFEAENMPQVEGESMDRDADGPEQE